MIKTKAKIGIRRKPSRVKISRVIKSTMKDYSRTMKKLANGARAV